MDLSKTPDHAKTGLIAMTKDYPLVNADKKELATSIIHRYLDGEHIKDIATELGLKSSERLYQILVEVSEEDWKRAQAARSLVEYENAESEMKGAKDALSLARAREILKSQQWKLEKTLRRIYGSDIPLDSTGKINIQINLGSNTPDAKVVDSDN